MFYMDNADIFEAFYSLFCITWKQTTKTNLNLLEPSVVPNLGEIIFCHQNSQSSWEGMGGA